ncbi:LOW QUALITY PROTEIN: Hypothetical protein PHPALM_4182 [Phytophthora palmivora]|uniref:Retrotransposon gag domain-containing protein n=1 Tax=Phytophthora palmivora TaxID=4796 RepID=A0A2P4YKG1_9STRA|nr:LOW QUALITY PROTEIN: Hypothetical protein PHPALM_4182 [Phytophthora palmivora]
MGSQGAHAGERPATRRDRSAKKVMAESTRVSSNVPKFTGKRGNMENTRRVNNIIIEYISTRIPGIAGSSVEKLASGRFLHLSSTMASEEHTGGFSYVLQHFEPSKYQSGLREKLQRLKRTADIESYNSQYSAIIFRVLCFANGLKPRTRSYLKLENPEKLSDAMDLAVKYELTHFIDDARDRKTDDGLQAYGGSYVLFLQEARKDNCFIWKKDQEKQKNDQPHRLSSRTSDFGSLSACPTWEVGPRVYTRKATTSGCFTTWAQLCEHLRATFLSTNYEYRQCPRFPACKRENLLPENIKITVFMDGLEASPSRTQFNTIKETTQTALQEEYSHRQARNPTSQGHNASTDGVEGATAFGGQNAVRNVAMTGYTSEHLA